MQSIKFLEEEKNFSVAIIKFSQLAVHKRKKDKKKIENFPTVIYE